MYDLINIVNILVDFMKGDFTIDDFTFSFWDITIYGVIFGTVCWAIGRIINND